MATIGTATGGAFFSKGANGLGLYAAATSQSGAGVGVHGFAQSPNGVGLLGDVASPCPPPIGACGAGFPIGVLARINATSGAAGIFEEDYTDGGGQLISQDATTRGALILPNLFP
jgi:hypothetical protein